MTKPVVALVGRPNVGKSTLFNRLAGEPRAIVDDVPGTTRDRLFGESSWNGVDFDIIDTGGIDPSSSRKDPLSIGSADYINQIRSQANMAIQEADVILFLTDAASGVTPADAEVAQMLRRNQKDSGWQAIPASIAGCEQSRFRRACAQMPSIFMNWPWVNRMPISSAARHRHR